MTNKSNQTVMHCAHKLGGSKGGRLLAISLLTLMSACAETDGLLSDQADGLTAGATVNAPLVLSHRAIDRSTLRLNYSINGGATRSASLLNEEDGSYIVIVNNTPGSSVSVLFTWYQELDDKILPLATFNTGPLSIGSQPQTIEIEQSSYVTTGDELDDDGDGFSNLEEIKANNNPFNSNDCPDCPTDIDLVVRRIKPGYDSPVIDGSYDGDVWTDNAQFKDRQGELLIDNLMIGSNGATVAPGYRWAGMHDGTNLYLMVFGRVSDNQRYSDSVQVVNDESIEVYIGSDPKTNNEFYDDDDFNFIIPLTGLGNSVNKSGLSSSRIQQGPSSAGLTLQNIEFATCLCSITNDIWELKVPLADVGLAAGDIFGIEIQANLDRDGGLRDAKWGWKHPARNTTDIDYTVSNPKYMGRALLE